MSLIKANNLAELLHKRVAVDRHRSAFLRKVAGVWTGFAWRDVESRVFEIARSLERAGIKRGDAVAVISQSRPEWFFVDLAIMSIGAVTVPIYAAVTADDVYDILRNSGARAIFVEDNVQADKIASVQDRIQPLVFRVSFERVADEQTLQLDAWLKTHSTDDKAPSATELEAWRHKASTISPEDLATLVYTSGTMGRPRGVELSHRNLLSTLSDLATSLQIGESDVSLLFLPVAHIMGRIEMWMSVATGLTNAYASSLSQILDDMAEVRPTVLVSVPRVYEKLHASIRTKFAQGTGLVKVQPFDLALHIGREYSRALRSAKGPDLALRLQHTAADKIYFQKIREKLGGRLRFSICGGAPLASELAEFFHACGILLLEGYGLTESTGPATMNTPEAFRFGSVGKPVPSIEMKLASDGEILLRGPALFRNYHSSTNDNDEDESADSKGYWRDSWFHTGDVGSLDPDGFLRVTDRKKDLIITAGGKNIAPLKIEKILQSDPLFSHALIVGEARRHLAALLTLNPNEARRLAEELGLGDKEPSDWISDESFHRLIRERLDNLNAQLPSYEAIRKYHILPRDFTVEAGELTPSLKLRRRFLIGKYADLIEDMYKN